MTPHERAEAIQLTRGMVAIVDADCFESVSRLKWYSHKSPGELFYARTMVWINGKRKSVLMHRCILMFPSTPYVDHRNGDSLDNRKSNLRPCTASQNQANARTYVTPKTSQYKGVRWDEHNSSWTAQIRVSGKQKHLGMFSDEVSAARAYDSWAKTLHGEFARCNFPLEAISELKRI